MPTKPKRLLAPEVDSAIATLERQGTRRNREGMARYAIPSDKAFGVSVGTLQRTARSLAPNHDLAAALWKTGWYEARMLASMVDDPARVTPVQMDRWCSDFDNWAICDTVCFKLFDRTPHAWDKVAQWAVRPDEFVRRAAFTLVRADGARQGGGRRAVRRRSRAHRADDRHFVKKAVNMALRATGKRNPALHVAAVVVARRLAWSSDTAARWVGKDALRELTSASVARRHAGRRGKSKPG